MKKLLLLLLLSFGSIVSVQAQAESFIGEIRMVGFDFAPEGWALCNGQLLQINQYPALYSLLGTRYGGDGRTTFGLPDLRGRLPIHYGQAPGYPVFTMGGKSGTLTPLGGTVSGKIDSTGVSPKVLVPLPAPALNGANYPPVLGVNYIISLLGIYPSRG